MGFSGSSPIPTLPLTPNRVKSKAPSLHRHYPASTVLRASPPPHTARPVSRELPVDDELPPPPLGFPVLRMLSCVCMLSSLPRQDQWKLFARTLPSAAAFPKREAGRLLHCAFRGLLNVYPCYGLHTHRVAFHDPLHRRLQRFRRLYRCFGCYRVERTSSRAGLSPAEKHRLSRRTLSTALRFGRDDGWLWSGAQAKGTTP